MAAGAFEKRVKRRVSGREHTFFAVCSPGLESVCMAELVSLGLSVQQLRMAPGGIEFEAKPAFAMQLNFFLKTASRILMRIARFRADSFVKLEKKLGAVDWILYLPRCRPKIQVSARKSRLYHSDAIAERCEKILQSHLEAGEAFLPAKTKADDSAVVLEQSVFIRAEQDVFTISVDSSGALLFKRGIKKRVTPAPLRENLASALLHLSGFSEKDLLIDPMCGSGTFSIEAACLCLNMAPGMFRRFAFEHWPCIREKAFSHLKKQSQAAVHLPEIPGIFASDLDAAAVAALNENLSVHPLLSRVVQSREADFFDLAPNTFEEAFLPLKKLIVLNPPYGKRLGHAKQTQAFFRQIGLKLQSDFKGWHLGILAPDAACLSALGFSLQPFSFQHGGLKICAGVGQIR